MYEKQGFYSGQPLKASQLDAMEDGIIEAQALAMEGAAGAANMEKGTGVGATQQLPDSTSTTFDFTGKNTNAYEYTKDESLTGLVEYGASNKCASTLGGKSAAKGSRSFSSGSSTIAKGDYSHTEGSNTVAYGTSSHAEGTGSFAYGQGSHAEGNSQALGKLSHAEGGSNIASGEASHAEGGSTTASGLRSHSEGDKTVASGNISHAEGCETVAGGLHSHAEGNGAQATGDASHAEGTDTIAAGNNSHAGGWLTEVTGDYAFGHGAGVKADGICQAVFGQYNKINENALLVVGNGSDTNNRKNIFEVQKNGDIWMTYNGKTYSFVKLLYKLNLMDDSEIQITQ